MEYYLRHEERPARLGKLAELTGRSEILDAPELPSTVGVFCWQAADGRTLFADLVNYDFDAAADCVTVAEGLQSPNATAAQHNGHRGDNAFSRRRGGSNREAGRRLGNVTLTPLEALCQHQVGRAVERYEAMRQVIAVREQFQGAAGLESAEPAVVSAADHHDTPQDAGSGSGSLAAGPPSTARTTTRRTTFDMGRRRPEMNWWSLRRHQSRWLPRSRCPRRTN